MKEKSNKLKDGNRKNCICFKYNLSVAYLMLC